MERKTPSILNVVSINSLMFPRSSEKIFITTQSVFAAWAFSTIAVIAPGLFPSGFRDADGNVGIYFEAGAVIVVLVLLGQILELRARERTGSAIRALLDLAAKSARLIRDDGTEQEGVTA